MVRYWYPGTAQKSRRMDRFEKQSNLGYTVSMNTQIINALDSIALFVGIIGVAVIVT